MKKILLIGVLFVFVLGIVNCGGSDDPVGVMKEMIGITNSLTDSMNKAENADDVAAALNNYSDSMKTLIPKMKALEEKYPELKQKNNNGKLPAMFKDIEPEFKKAMGSMMGAMMKMGKYMKDPKVVEANKRLQEVMKKMR